MEPQPLHQIRRLIKVMGATFAEELLRETQAVEAAGGLFLEREQRRRTPGGVFFHLARNRMTKPQRGKVFANPIPSEQLTVQPLDLPEALQALTQQFGKASTVKLTVIGRPTQVVDRGEVVIFGLLSDKAPALPKGLPAPPPQTKYLVLVAKKQWTKVAESIKAEDDVLIIEGYPAFEPRHAGITVYALSVTTKKQQQAKREAQRASPDRGSRSAATRASSRSGPRASAWRTTACAPFLAPRCATRPSVKCRPHMLNDSHIV